MLARSNLVATSIAVIATCAAIAFGYAWWTLKQGQEAQGDADQEVSIQMKKQMARLKFDMDALAKQRAELSSQLESLPSLEELNAQGEQIRERTRALPNAGELRREAVGIRPDGSHARTGEIPPTVLNRMNQELGLSPQELRKLQGE